MRNRRYPFFERSSNVIVNGEIQLRWTRIEIDHVLGKDSCLNGRLYFEFRQISQNKMINFLIAIFANAEGRLQLLIKKLEVYQYTAAIFIVLF